MVVRHSSKRKLIAKVTEVLALSLSEPHPGFCVHGASQRQHANGVVRDSRNTHLLVHTRAPWFHWISLTQHTFKDKIRSFKTETTEN